ncbi:M56 family metallopeptidase [Maribacter sp. PR1]|uniref:M56 family metallopeptidase n=1 Tax=Maribacter cobaltidurans TaxID=1178778 RepID=A0ABU7IQP6_9FLAO|nr:MULTISPECIES: M56 family metallopeptidase [Maribacter]MDC6387900.1 M56 family metallopeptidase [Maribacter sp. PR1]MEE1975289.1 M56 family metallopeptidase [Maribacter cobaltidurans]
MNPDIILNAIYKTLLHSLWQGGLLAIVGGLIIFFGKHLKPSIKYLLLTFSLFLFLGGTIYTFLSELNQTNRFLSEKAYPSSKTLLEPSLKGEENLLVSVADKVYTLYDYYLAHYDRVFVFIWFIVLCFKVALMSIDVFHIRKLQTTKIKLVDSKIEKILLSLNDRLSLKKSIGVFESAIAKTPLVIGALKPIILLPVGLATSMTIEQIEAIMAHEMAHIKRKDFLVNLIQSVMEIIFFFNIPVLWVTSLIRNERELCCDDIAINITGNKIIYVNTLVECIEYRPPIYGIAFAGNKNLLLKRVKRILSIQKPSLNSFDKLFIGLCLVCAIFLTSILGTKPTNGSNHYFFSSFIDGSKASKDVDRVNSNAIIEQLKKSNIISDLGNFSVKITNYALYVNGNKQSETLHRQILKDFVKDYQYRLHFTTTVKSGSD